MKRLFFSLLIIALCTLFTFCKVNSSVTEINQRYIHVQFPFIEDGKYLVKIKSISYLSTVTGSYLIGFYQCNETGKINKENTCISFDLIRSFAVNALLDEFTKRKFIGGRMNSADVNIYKLKNLNKIYEILIRNEKLIYIKSEKKDFNWTPDLQSSVRIQRSDSKKNYFPEK